VENPFMGRAIELAIENVRSGRGGPFAAVVVKGERIVATGTNLVTSTNDPTAHAEVVAIRAACRDLQTFQLAGCDVYTTCEPAPCASARSTGRDPIAYSSQPSRATPPPSISTTRSSYDEIGVPYTLRQIPFIPLMRDEALVVFREWESKSDRVKY
jgi:hypothetical protein